MKIIQKYAYSCYLGIAVVEIAGFHFYNWQLYAILVPLIILVEWRARLND